MSDRIIKEIVLKEIIWKNKIIQMWTSFKYQTYFRWIRGKIEAQEISVLRGSMTDVKIKLKGNMKT